MDTNAQAPQSLISLAENIENAADDFTAISDEIQELQSALKPGISLSEAQRHVKTTSSQLEISQKRINRAHSHFNKELEASMPSETWATKIQPKGAAAHQALLSIILRHFERQGLASVAREMLKEDNLLPSVDLNASAELQEILQCLKTDTSTGFAPLVTWMNKNQEELSKLESPLPSYITELKFFQAIITRGDADALVMLREQYAANSLVASTIERLAGSIPLYGTSSWKASQNYIENLRRQAVDTLIHNFWQLYPSAISEALLVNTLEASVIAFPVLDRLSKALAMTPWSSENELPAEIALPSRLQFHPIFVCPVLKEQTGETPPKLLPCGHVISAEAFSTLSKSQSHVYVKCPYCPRSFGLQEVRDVRFIRKK